MLDEDGRLVGLIFATLKLGQGNPQTGDTVINEMALAVDLRPITQVLDLLANETNKQKMIKTIDSLEYLKIKDKEIQNSTSFQKDRPEIADLVKQHSFHS